MKKIYSGKGQTREGGCSERSLKNMRIQSVKNKYILFCCSTCDAKETFLFSQRFDDENQDVGTSELHLSTLRISGNFSEDLHTSANGVNDPELVPKLPLCIMQLHGVTLDCFCCWIYTNESMTITLLSVMHGIMFHLY